jgi:hypothetical protein
MKKSILFLILILPLFTFSQEKEKEKKKVIGESSTIKRVSVGVSFYQDFWFNWPKGMNVRAINQGSSAFMMYNFPLGKSPLSFGIGVGVGCHNLYSNTTINDIKADTITFTPIPDSISYKKSKLGLTYLDFPLELKFKAKNKFNMAIGVKLGYLLDSKTKYKGDDINGNQVIEKFKTVRNVDKFRFGPTIRIGYNWFQVSAYWSVTKIFDKGLGPDLYPLSVGITFMPF